MLGMQPEQIFLGLERAAGANPIAAATTVSRRRRTTRSSTRLPYVVAEALLLGFWRAIGGCVIDHVGTLDIQDDVEQSHTRTSEVSAPLLVASRRFLTTGCAKR